MYSQFRKRIRLELVDSHLLEILSKAGKAFVLKGIGTALAFAFSVILARQLGAEDTGIYFLSLTVITIASLVSRLGLDQCLVRFIAVSAIRSDEERINTIYRTAMLTVLITSLVAAGLIIFFSDAIAVLLNQKQLAMPLRVMALSIPSLSLLILQAESYRGLKKIATSVLLQGKGGLLLPLLNIIFLLIFHRTFQTYAAQLAYLLSTVVLLFVGTFMWFGLRSGIKGNENEPNVEMRILLWTSLPLLGIMLINVLNKNLGTLFLGLWLDIKSVGIYNVILRLAILISFILQAINLIAAPKFATLFAQKEYSMLASLSIRLSIGMGALALCIIIPMLLFPADILRIFGDDFIVGAKALRVMAVGQFINVAAGPVGTLLIMGGKERFLQRYVFGSFIFNIMISLILIPRMGILGAALANSLTLVLLNFLSFMGVQRHTKVNLLP